MSEFPSSSTPEFEREKALRQVIEQYLPEDAEFLADMDEEDQLGYIYGQLLEMGEDPDVILQEFGITEKDEDEDEV
ncbi:MAG TPA: hypothetical protein PK096_02990 [Candidatus Saccharibacteria bacterium]|nr:hypothetical protein [Candidatus Saccharibacteria bacterium]HRK94307.1 hypothetical protein [Candidatus Saccharibacteria bacterium]